MTTIVPVSTTDWTAHAGAFGGGWSVDGSSETTRFFLSGMNMESLPAEFRALSASASMREIRWFNSGIKKK